MEIKRKLMLGEVVSDKLDKTIVVKYVRSFKHEKFNKIVKKTTKYKVHDEKALAKIGDKITRTIPTTPRP